MPAKERSRILRCRLEALRLRLRPRAQMQTRKMYYSLLRADMGARYPHVDPHLLDHLETLEAFLDTSIMAGVSFGTKKAKLAVTEGELLGHVVGRKGASVQKSKTLAIVQFPPLKEKVQQFLGCTNFLRYYLQPVRSLRESAR